MAITQRQSCRNRSSEWWGGHFTWIFRRKPAVLRRWYISRGFAFRVTFEPGNKYVEPAYLVEVQILDSKTRCYFTLIPDTCLYLDKHGGLTQVCSMHEQERENFRNCFRNRLIEYGASYFVPIEKGFKDVV